VKNSTEIGLFFTKNFLRFAASNRCTASALKVYFVLLHYMNWTTGVTYPNYMTIKDFTGYSKSTIGNAIKELVKLKLINKWIAPPNDVQQFGKPMYKVLNYDGHKINQPGIFKTKKELEKMMGSK